MPCQILEDELLDVPPAYRNDAPSLKLDLLCQPQLLFSSANNGYKGFFATRKAPFDWTVIPMPVDLATGALLQNDMGHLYAVANDGAFGGSLWAFTAEGWKHVADVPEKVTSLERGVALAEGGQILAGFSGDAGELHLGVFGASWTVEQLGQSAAPPPLALSEDGAPSLVAWSSESGEWALRWYSPPYPSEIAMPFGSGSLTSDAQRPVLAVTAADAQNPMGKPHVLAMRSAPDFAHELVYLTRQGEGAWDVRPIEPVPAGTMVWPLGIVTDAAGEVRLFYSRYEATKPGTGSLVVAWPEGSGVQTAVVTEGFSAFGASFDRDGAGRIHAALYTLGLSSDVSIRYMVLGP